MPAPICEHEKCIAYYAGEGPPRWEWLEDGRRRFKIACGLKVRVTLEEATADKGYPHPGNVIALPNGGGEIVLQYGHPDEVGRNGCFSVDILRGLRDNLAVYQHPSHPLACYQTARTIAVLDAAIESIEMRRQDRQARGVHQTDQA